MRDRRRSSGAVVALVAAVALGISAAPAIAGQEASEKTPKVTPLWAMGYLEFYYERTVAPWEGIASNGAMNNISHFQVTPHQLLVTATCDLTAKYSANVNTVSYVRVNLRGDYEIGCADGDAHVQHNLIPLRVMCNNSSFRHCPDMRFGPALAHVGSEAAGAAGVSPQGLGSVTRVVIDQQKGKSLYSLRVFYARSGRGRQLKELTFTVDHGTASHAASWY